MATDSRVVDALHDESNLRHLLQALGCDVEHFGSNRNIHCPMPDHDDSDPSCTVRANQGLFHCQTQCFTILPLDLVVAHGRAADRAEAARWVEDLLGIEREPLGPPRRVVDDPSLSVAQYLALKHLSPMIVERFGLRDVRVHEDSERRRKGFDLRFEAGFHGAVLMPNDPPPAPGDPRALVDLKLRPRIRNEFGARWPAKVIDASGAAVQFSTRSTAPGAPSSELAHPQRIYGLPQLQLAAPGAPLHRTLLVVEGESDVHALHDAGITCCLGLPGVGAFRTCAMDIVGALLAAEGGDVAHLADCTVLVWSEPGAAGAKLPGDVAGAITAACAERDLPTPRVATLRHDAFALPGGTAAKDPCELLRLLVPLHRGSLAPARAELRRMIEAAAFVAAGRAPQELDPAAPAAAVAPEAAAMPAPAALQFGSDPWEGMDSDGALPAPDPLDVPAVLEHLGAKFVRTRDGWAEAKETQDGVQVQPACSIFDVSRVECIDGADFLVLRAPRRHLLEFATARLARADLADPRRAAAALKSIGVSIAMRRTPQVVAIAQALAERHLARHGIVQVPTATGWSGRPGTSQFAGIEIEPVNEFGARMFAANERRRARHTDTAEAAQRWWSEGVEPLIRLPRSHDEAPAAPSARAAAPLLALGAAAAAVLVGPLADVGVAVAPVVWLAGRGGGGKTVTQRLAASIFAPKLADLDGQCAFFTSANISQAALSARVDSCRDLPLILDDVTQLPPLPGSTSRGDAARIEAAAALGMLVFNRKPIERATREGGLRQTRAFRCTALFSAEVSMSSELSKAIVTVGHRRRISTIEAQPMHDRGLGPAYAERVGQLESTIGGAPGDLLVIRSRELVSARELRGEFEHCRALVAAVPGSELIESTQLGSLAVNVLGFSLLAEVCDGFASRREAQEFMAGMLAGYLAAGAGAGGATRDSDLSGVDAALRAVDDLRAAHPLRFDNQVLVEDVGYQQPAPMSGYLGRQIRSWADGTRRVVLLHAGMELLSTRYGVTMQVIEQAVADGRCRPAYQLRMADGSRARGTLWLLPPAGADDPDDDPTLDSAPRHDPDPHGLSATPPAAAPARVHVPGGSVAAEPASCEDKRPEEMFMPEDDLWRATTAGGDLPALDEFAAALLRWITTGARRCMEITEDGETIVSMFGWGSGLYLVGDGPACRQNPSMLKRVRLEARQELEGLQLQYRHAGEKALEQRRALIEVAAGDPSALPAQPDPPPAPVHVVADFPLEGDARWARIDALGTDLARGQWAKVQSALYELSRADATDETRAHWHDAHIKAYRIHLMARYRRPEWFIAGHDELA